MSVSPSSLQSSTPDQATEAAKPKVHLAWRMAGWSLFVAVMAVGFLGYLTPGMRLNWETIAAMCGF